MHGTVCGGGRGRSRLRYVSGWYEPTRVRYSVVVGSGVRPVGDGAGRVGRGCDEYSAIYGRNVYMYRCYVCSIRVLICSLFVLRLHSLAICMVGVRLNIHDVRLCRATPIRHHMHNRHRIFGVEQVYNVENVEV